MATNDKMVWCALTTWAVLRPQLPKGTSPSEEDKPTLLACVHVGGEFVTVDACALRDWMRVAEKAVLTFETVTCPQTTYFTGKQPKNGPPLMNPNIKVIKERTLRCLVTRAGKLTARFYPQHIEPDRHDLKKLPPIWEVYP